MSVQSTLTLYLYVACPNQRIARKVYYVPIYRALQGVLTQLRLRPGLEATADVGRTNSSLAPRRGDSFEIDWVSESYREIEHNQSKTLRRVQVLINCDTCHHSHLYAE